MAKTKSANFWWLILFLAIGAVTGGFLGNLVGNIFPALKFGYDFGVTTHTWDLIVASLTFGFQISLNIFTVLGIIIAIFFYRRF